MAKANHTRLKMGTLAYNLLHILRRLYPMGEEVRSSIEWLIKVGAKSSYHAKRCDVPVASASQLAHYYRTKFGYGEDLMKSRFLSAPEISHTWGPKWPIYG